jgi:hypothetical protein
MVFGTWKNHIRLAVSRLLYLINKTFFDDYCTEVCEQHFFSCSIQVIRHLDGCKADLVVCDGAPDGKEKIAYFEFIYLKYMI